MGCAGQDHDLGGSQMENLILRVLLRPEGVRLHKVN
jgi:hypothetical protein